MNNPKYISFEAEPVAKYLNTLLATYIDFYFLYKGYHWNLSQTQDFYEYHKLFDSHASTIYNSIDLIAERVRIIGHPTIANLQEFISNSHLQTLDLNHDLHNFNKIISNLVSAHNLTIGKLHDGIILTQNSNDYSDTDILTELLKQQEQMSWFIQSGIA
jgi:starvation-inducible DNA-binding protein